MKKYNKHIIITGSARSGTSWLCELMARQHRYRLLFEPEHEFQTKKGHLLCDKLITTKNETQEIKKYLTKVFLNRIDSDWIAQHSNRKFKRHLLPFIPKKYIIKFVRANLSAHYMNEKFRIPVIYILRNPYDVIASQMRVKFPWLFNLNHFQEQEELVVLIKEKIGFDITKNSYSDIEKLAIRWCIENVVPLQLKGDFINKANVVKYEDLKGNFDVFKQLTTAFNVDLHPKIESYFLKPSSKTHPKSTIIKGKQAESSLPDNEYKLVKNILREFDVTLYDI